MSKGHAPYYRQPDGVAKISDVGWINSLKQYFRVPETQESMNMFPDYMEGRHNKYSVYQQIMNALMLGIHDINNKLRRSADSSLPQTFRPDNIDVIHSITPTEGFAKVEYNNGSEWIASKIQTALNHEEWWYGTLPNLIKQILTFESQIILLDNVPLERTLNVDNSLITYPAGLYITLSSDGASYINNIKGKDILPTVITINGKDEFDTDRQESFSFFYPTSQRSHIAWKEIYDIDCSYWEDAVYLTIANDLPVGSLHEDLTVRHSDSNRITKSIFWNNDNNYVYLSTLTANGLLDYHAGIKTFNTNRQYTLLNESDVALDDIQSILPSEVDDMLYVITAAGKLYGYSKLDNFSSNSAKANQIKTSNKLITLQIEKESDKYKVLGLFNKSEVNRKIIKYRFSVIQEDDTRLYFNNGVWGADESYIDYPFKKDYGFVTPDLDYDSSFDEDLLFIVDIQADDGETYTDALVVDSDNKRPLFAIDIPSFSTDYQLSYSADNFLVLSDDSTYFKFELTDNTCIYDENEDVIIFKHRWSQIRFKDVADDLLAAVSNITILHNITNHIDQWGALLNLDRNLGERSHTYVKRLQDASAHPSASTKMGLIHSISRELNISPVDTIKISHAEDFHLEIKNPNISVTIDDTTTTLNLFKFTAAEIGQASVEGTIQDVFDWLESLSFTVTILDTDFLLLPARCLMPYNNYEYSYNNMWPKATRLDLHIPSGAKLISSLTLIDNYEFVVDEAALLATTDPSFTIIGDNTIITNLELTHNDLVHYVIMHSIPTLKAAVMAIHSIHESESSQFAPGYISSLAKDLISTVESTASHKWID